MEDYIKTIGFKNINSRKDVHQLIKSIIHSPDRKKYFQLNTNEAIYCYEKDFGNKIGMTVLEIVDNNGTHILDSYFPYVYGMNCLYNDNIEVERITGKENYAGICDENNLGIPLIFHINNPIDYLNIVYHPMKGKINCINLSGISTKGIIILPIKENEQERIKERQGNEWRSQMIEAARAGSQEALERLTLDDMDTYNMVTSRSRKEDIFTIVTSYFMPYSVECDKYSVLGTITDSRIISNKVTGESMYYISMECNSIEIDFVISRENLLGEPAVGRRFKGNIWLQGEVESI